MNDYPDLFGYSKPINEPQKTYVCIKCNIEQPATNFYVVFSGEVKRTCQSCVKGHFNTIKRLRKENKYPDEDYCCPICTRDAKEIGKYGQVKDDLTKVKRAVKYLKKHKEKLDEINT